MAVDVTKSSDLSSVSGASTFSSTPMMSGASPVSGGAVGKSNIPKDLIPFGAGTAIITTVNPDGTLGRYARTFPQFLISANVSTTRNSEDLTTGEGADIPFATDEAFNLAMEVNAYNSIFHAIVGGRDIVEGEMRGFTEKSFNVIKAGTDPDFTYTYVFAAGDTPVANALGDFEMRLFDLNGNALTLSTATEAPVAGQFKYDSTNQTISVSAEYENEVLTAFYFKTMTDSMSESATSIIKTTELQIEIYSTMQSAKTKAQYKRYQKIARAVVSGDLPEPNVQKSINTNMTYNFVSQQPPGGVAPYVNELYPL